MKTTIYSIMPSTDSKIVGVYPQLEAPKNYFNESNNLTTINNQKLCDVSPNLEKFLLKNRAKVTDILRAELLDPSLGMFVNDKFISLLNPKKTNYMSTYPSTILQSKEKIFSNYFFLHLINNFSDYIDFNTSLFYHLTTKESIKLTNEISQLPPLVRVKQLAMSNVPQIFRLPSLVNIFISEDFKNQIEMEKINGLLIEEFNYFEIIMSK